MWVPLILSDFVFDEDGLEVPEQFGDVAGVQLTQQHDFPGGIRTHRSYGYFPSALKWKARFHGTDASDSVEQIKRILFAAQEVELSHGERAWLGRLVKFAPVVHHQWLYTYDLEFWPRVDISSGSPQPQVISGFGSVLALHILALQGIISGETSGTLLFASIASFVVGPVGAFLDTAQAAVLAAGGIIDNITFAEQQAIAAQSLAALAALAPFQASSDPTLSSPAYDTAARVQAIASIVTVAPDPITTLHVINPNLVVLATQYYQDPQHWQVIADANGLADPQPIGSFDLMIPPHP